MSENGFQLTPEVLAVAGKLGMSEGDALGYLSSMGRAMVVDPYDGRAYDANTINRFAWHFFTYCVANRLDPLKGDAHPTVRKESKGMGDRKVYAPVLVPVTSYHVFVARVRSQGWVVTGSEVYENDVWGGWDSVAERPVSHVVPLKDRGRILGAWASATNERTGLRVGRFYPWAEIAQLDRNGKPTRAWESNPGTMAFKAGAERVCRLICPEECRGYGAEEMGVDVTGEAPKVLPPPPPQDAHGRQRSPSAAPPGVVLTTGTPPASEASTEPPTGYTGAFDETPVSLDDCGTLPDEPLPPSATVELEPDVAAERDEWIEKMRTMALPAQQECRRWLEEHGVQLSRGTVVGLRLTMESLVRIRGLLSTHMAGWLKGAKAVA